MDQEVKIVPTVGRVVYYKSYGTPGGEYPSIDRSAIITEVTRCDEEGNYYVGLCVLNPTGLFFNQNVKQGKNPGQWDWMPYQKQSASNSQSAEPRPNVGNLAGSSIANQA